MSAAVPWKPRAFNEDDLAEVERKLFGTLTNTYGFFALYANIDGYSYDESKTIPAKSRPEIDRWVLSKLNSLVKTCTEAMEDYDLTRGTRAIQDFILEQVSNWYVRRNRRRFWKGELAGNADKQAAYDTLHECLTTVAKLMAPYAPYFPDWLYSSLMGSANGALRSSVHLALYPEVRTDLIDEKLEKRMEAAQIASSLVRQMRERAKLKVRQPLERILIPVANRYESEELRKVEDVIREEVNVKRVEYVESGDSDVIKLRAKANFKVLGAKLGKSMKSAAARIGKLTQEEIREYQQRGELSLDVEGQTITFERGDFDVSAEDVEGWLVSSEGGFTVALDTQLTPALKQEGIAREFVNRVQNLRKDSGFDVTDRISIAVSTGSDDLRRAIESHAEYIRQETLAEALTMEPSTNGEAATADVEIGDDKATIALSRL
jgi:isoleucyl-tRNA synthetase